MQNGNVDDSLANPKMVCQANVLGRGWTRAMVKALLPTPDKKVANPHYCSAGAPMNLYTLDRVMAAEGTGEYARMKAKADARRSSAKVALATKREDLMKYVESVTIDIPEFDDEELILRSIRSYNSLASDKGGDFGPASTDSDPLFLERICVNYLRHECSKYEEELERVHGKVGSDEARRVIRDKVYDAIGEAYPDLWEECHRQMDRRDQMEYMKMMGW